MKEVINRFLEWFSRDTFVADICGNEFARGLIVGAAAAALILLAVQLFLLIFFRRKAVSSIKVKSDFGTVEVNSSAVTNVIKSAAKALESLEISKIRIYERGKQLDFVLRAVMDASGKTTPALMEKLTVILRQQMKEVFGVENIRDIKLVIVSCKNCGEDEEFEDFDSKDDEAVKGVTNSFAPLTPAEKTGE
ncbi:MAG: hypothetical protein E7051_01745 [Lentisphaerae bacterium]|nr:hypothetical protein [Lentisphaerota bacterium]